MNIDYLALISYVLIANITPGPNNISSAVMGLNYGYKGTFKYLLGITTGVISVLLFSALLSEALLTLIPHLDFILAIVGSLYISYLAFKTLKTTYKFNEDNRPTFNFTKGIFLQILNPKAVIFSITIYSTFLKDIKVNSFYLPLSLVLLSFITFLSVSIWTLFGSLIKKYMSNNSIRFVINVILSLLLFYTAVKMSGILNLLK